MAPKKVYNSNKKFALVRWIANGSTSVISCTLIRVKDQKEGHNVRLLWVDASGIEKLHEAKVLKIGG